MRHRSCRPSRVCITPSPWPPCRLPKRSVPKSSWRPRATRRCASRASGPESFLVLSPFVGAAQAGHSVGNADSRKHNHRGFQTAIAEGVAEIGNRGIAAAGAHVVIVAGMPFGAAPRTRSGSLRSRAGRRLVSDRHYIGNETGRHGPADQGAAAAGRKRRYVMRSAASSEYCSASSNFTVTRSAPSKFPDWRASP